MDKLTIGYEFEFTLSIRKRNGKTYNGHRITGLGLDFKLALWDVFHTLKKRKSEIITIREVRPSRITSAFDQDKVSLKLRLVDHPPLMPDDPIKN